jgi:DNA repair exonuclease SbcCD ATPase subunit
MFSYGGGDNTVYLSNEPLVQIVGQNGSGKSSIPMVLEETLFNKNSKGIKKGDVLNRLVNTNKYSSTLEFEAFSDEYVLSVSRTGAAQKVKLLKNGCDISSHTATDTFKQVEKLLGVDQKAFSQLVYQSSSNSLQFLTATDTNRKKFLIDLLSLDKYVSAFEKIKVLHKDLQLSISTVEGKIATVSGFIDKYKNANLDEKPLKELPEALPDGYTNELAELKSLLAGITANNRKITDNNHYTQQLNEFVKEDLVLPDSTLDSTTVISSNIAVLRSEINNLRNLIKEYRSSEGTCPTCKQPLPKKEGSVEPLVEKEAALMHELRDFEHYLAAIKAEEARRADIQRSIEKFEKLSALVDSSLPTELYDESEVQASINKIMAQVTDYQVKLKDATDYNNASSAHNAKVHSIVEQLSEFSKELISLQSSLANLSEQFSNLEILKKVFSTNGLIAYKIESSVKELQNLTNEYLAELSDGRFQLSFEVTNDKLNVIISDNGNSIDITALSAGELARVNTATLLAIRKLMNHLSKARINLLFLDETIDNLDSNGKEKLVEVLLNEEGLNTFLISHGYSHPLLRKLSVVKEEGLSRLEDG